MAELAKYILELFKHRFDKIGSITRNKETGEFEIGRTAHSAFYADGRAGLPLDRGPFDSARAYYLACGWRELDCSRALFVQDASPEYRRELEAAQLQIERIVGMMQDFIARCRGLDEDDSEMAPISLDVHQMPLKSVYVSQESLKGAEDGLFDATSVRIVGSMPFSLPISGLTSC